MPSRVLWLLDNETDGKTFERLAVDLLYRGGYKDIVPVQPQDGGRDAEEYPRRGRGRAGETAFFQFSSEEDWKGKIRRDARKLKAAHFDFSTLVFVTTRNAPGVACDSLAREFRTDYGWELIVYSREWLRLQLEEAHPDIAKKYLGVDAPEWSPHLMAQLEFNSPPDARLAAAWRAYHASRFDRAAVEFSDFVEGCPEAGSDVWQALAWCQYRTYRYDEALASTARALSIEPAAQARSIRACILVEKGSRESDRSCLLEGRSIFRELVEACKQPDWHALYNLANAESALGNHAAAIGLYRRALAIQRTDPQIWKNLATAYHHTGEHQHEAECLDTVLTLDPEQFEGLVSKATTLMVDFNRPQDASPLLERALKAHPENAVKWPHVWYWAAEARRRSGDAGRALRHVDEGLAHQPGHTALRRLKSDLLADLASDDPTTVPIARAFWQRRLAEEPRDYIVRERLARLESANGDDIAAWNLIDECVRLTGLTPPSSLKGAGFSIDQCLTAFRFLPQYMRFRERLPASDYWRADDPLYDLPFPPLGGRGEELALTACLAVPFGLGFQALETKPGERRAPGVIRNHAEFLRPLVVRAIAESAKHFAHLIGSPTSGPDAVAQNVTDTLLFLALIGLREFPRQRSWIYSQFGISLAEMDTALEGFDENGTQADVASDALIVLERESGFLSAAATGSRSRERRSS